MVKEPAVQSVKHPALKMENKYCWNYENKGIGEVFKTQLDFYSDLLLEEMLLTGPWWPYMENLFENYWSFNPSISYKQKVFLCLDD